MKGANGHGYTFRKLEKHPERVLPKEWQESELRAVAIDQTSAAHPAATVIVGSLAQSVGIPFYGSRLAVMPDDPALGEFRETFGGTRRHVRRVPRARHEGHHRGDLDLRPLEEVEGGRPHENRVDARAFLKARLFDLVVGNWDRHQAQWRWARFGSEPVWVPLPEDADQAFTRYEGKAMGAVRRVVPRFMRYSGEYPKRMEGLTTNNYDVTRWLLTRLEWPVFEEVARELASQMTDAVIDEAMRQMPPEWYAIDGAQMTKDLRQRRDGIVAYARKFYEHLADRVDVRGTDRADLATVEHLGDGSLRLTLAPLQGDGTAGAAYYERRFLPKETDEIRLYLLRRRRPRGRHRREQGRHPPARAHRRRQRHGRRLAERRPRRAGPARPRRPARPGHEGQRPRVEEPGPGAEPPLARAAELRPLDGADDRRPGGSPTRR